MSKAIVRSWLVATALLFTTGLHAEADQPKAYVVLVGVGEYQDSAIKPRKNADADALAMYDLLTNKSYFQCPPERIKLLTSKKDEARKGESATRDNILKALQWASESVGADDMLLLYWVGQGAPIGDHTCYFAANSTLKGRDKDAVGASEMELALTKAKSTRIVTLIDVNFRGYDAGSEKIGEAGLDKLFEELDGINEDDVHGEAKPITTITSGDGISAPIDLEKNGLFTTMILEGLKGSADNEGGEADGRVTVSELFSYLLRDTPRRAQLASKRDHQIRGKFLTPNLQLTSNPTAAAKSQTQLEKLETLLKDGKITEEIAKEGRELLNRMPRLANQRTLRQKYQAMVDGSLSVDSFMEQRKASLDSLKMSRADAETFAGKVLRVANIAKGQYVKPVKMQTLVASAIKGLYRRADEKIPEDVTQQLAKIEDLPDDGMKTLLADVRQKLGNRDDLKGQKAVDLALESMLHSLDDYSSYIDPEKMAEFERMTRQMFIGVGIVIREDTESEMVRVVSPLYGSPAYKAGIKTDDLIIKVTNVVDKKGNKLTEPETVTTKGMKTTDAQNKILGKRDTKVILTVKREGVAEPIDFEITRGDVEVETVLGVRRKADDSWDYYLDPANKIGYIYLTQFALNTERDLKKVLEHLVKDGLHGLVLDLRFNPGGYLDAAVDISDMFIDDGLIVQIRPGRGQPHNFTGKSRDSLLNFPLVVLVNGGSASASEIVSACIQDHNRGIVMGERSFGKGSVQNIMKINLGDGDSEVKLTTASFWRPSGKNLMKTKTSKEADDWGVRPHKEYTIGLNLAERSDLWKYFRDLPNIPRRDVVAKPKKDPMETPFVDKQLEGALGYLRGQVTAKASTKKAG